MTTRNDIVTGPGDIVTGAGDYGGLASYVFPEFHSQGEVSLYDEVGAASIIPGELPPIVRMDVAIEDRRGIRGAAEAVDSQPGGDERLERGFGPEIAGVIERDEVYAIIRGKRRLPCLLKREVVGAVRITRFQNVVPRQSEARPSGKTPPLGEPVGQCDGRTDTWPSKGAGAPYGGHLAATTVQERAAAFEENLKAQRRTLSASPRESQDQKQYQGRNNSSASHIATLHDHRREFPSELRKIHRIVSIP
jgi:hypothetical protein